MWTEISLAQQTVVLHIFSVHAQKVDVQKGVFRSSYLPCFLVNCCPYVTIFRVETDLGHWSKTNRDKSRCYINAPVSTIEWVTIIARKPQSSHFREQFWFSRTPLIFKGKVLIFGENLQLLRKKTYFNLQGMNSKLGVFRKMWTYGFLIRECYITKTKCQF